MLAIGRRPSSIRARCDPTKAPQHSAVIQAQAAVYGRNEIGATGGP
jgi:hypothetical protein